MLNGVETATGKIGMITRNKTGNTKTAESKTIASGNTATHIGIIEAIKAEITAMPITEAIE